jgi:GNAT superfamily N-acetyltransferase
MGTLPGMTYPVQVRPADDADAEAWTALYRGYRAFYRYQPDDAVVQRVWSWILDPNHEVNSLVATIDGRVVGLANHRRFARTSMGATGLFLDDLFTDPDVRGRGVGRALLTALSDLAAREELVVVRWLTAPDNTTARALYDATATATPWVTYDLVPGSL